MQPRRDIDDYHHRGNRKLKEAILPPDCKIIGREAFANSQIRKLVTFPETLEETWEGAFSENRSLKEVIFPASLESIGAYCYKNCTALETVKFEAGSKCRSIPEDCFYSCTQLNSIVFPENLRIIQSRAFYRCKELKEITLPDTLTKIGAEAFYFCPIETLELPEAFRSWFIKPSLDAKS